MYGRPLGSGRGRQHLDGVGGHAQGGGDGLDVGLFAQGAAGGAAGAVASVEGADVLADLGLAVGVAQYGFDLALVGGVGAVVLGAIDRKVPDGGRLF